jgi:hypothetical protein
MAIFLVFPFLLTLSSDHDDLVHVTDVGDELHLLDKSLLILGLGHNSDHELRL